MKRAIQFIGVVSAIIWLSVLGACSAKEIDETEKAEAVDVENYSFVDVQGNIYEAQLLQDRPLCQRDYSCLTWDDGHPYYKDMEGNPASLWGVG